MSSSMRWRSGLMGFSLIGAPVLRLECLTPRSSKTESPPVIPAQSAWLLSFRLTANIPAAFSRGSGFVHCPRAAHLLPWSRPSAFGSSAVEGLPRQLPEVCHIRTVLLFRPYEGDNAARHPLVRPIRIHTPW